MSAVMHERDGLDRLMPAVMCLDAVGSALFATREASRMCERWNRDLKGAALRMPEAVADLLQRVSQVSAWRPQPEREGMRLAHPSRPDLAVMVERGTSLAAGGEDTCYLLMFVDQQDETTLSEPAAPATPGSTAEAQRILALLTPSEQRVALLVAQGLRNSEIADSLHRSRRTIEYQLNAVYRKLDINCRTQLVRALLSPRKRSGAITDARTLPALIYC